MQVMANFTCYCIGNAMKFFSNAMILLHILITTPYVNNRFETNVRSSRRSSKALTKR